MIETTRVLGPRRKSVLWRVVLVVGVVLAVGCGGFDQPARAQTETTPPATLPTVTFPTTTVTLPTVTFPTTTTTPPPTTAPPPPTTAPPPPTTTPPTTTTVPPTTTTTLPPVTTTVAPTTTRPPALPPSTTPPPPPVVTPAPTTTGATTTTSVTTTTSTTVAPTTSSSSTTTAAVDVPEATLRIVGLSIGPPTIRPGGPIIVTVDFSEGDSGSIGFIVAVDGVALGDPVLITDPEDDRAQVTRTLPDDLAFGEHRLQLLSTGDVARVIAGRDFVVAVGSSRTELGQQAAGAGEEDGLNRWVVAVLGLLVVGVIALVVSRHLGKRSLAPGPGTMAASVTSATWARQHKRRRRGRF